MLTGGSADKKDRVGFSSAKEGVGIEICHVLHMAQEIEISLNR
jgi:hypothetical protein